MSKNPGTIKEIIEVKLPRPRDNGDIRSSADFSLLRDKIWELLQDVPVGEKKAEAVRKDAAEKILNYAGL